MQTVAALTILRDNIDDLEAWLRHYTRQVGRENCYLVCAGTNSRLSELAEGCSVISLPKGAAGTLIQKRGRLANNLIAALLNYHKHVVISELDERVIVDPDVAEDLKTYLLATPGRQVLTPLGLELIGPPAREAKAQIAGPTPFVRVAPQLCKPCVLSSATSLSRDGRFSRYPKLHMPEPLYLLRYRPREDAKVGEEAHDRAGFDLSAPRQKMMSGWQKMGASAYWHFEMDEETTSYRLPQRFHDLL